MYMKLMFNSNNKDEKPMRGSIELIGTGELLQDCMLDIIDDIVINTQEIPADEILKAKTQVESILKQYFKDKEEWL